MRKLAIFDQNPRLICLSIGRISRLNLPYEIILAQRLSSADLEFCSKTSVTNINGHEHLSKNSDDFQVTKHQKMRSLGAIRRWTM